MTALTPIAPQAEATEELNSIFDMILDGGPLMIPIGLCSIVALAYVVERSVRLSPMALGSRGFQRDLLREVESGGTSQALALCDKAKNSVGRVLEAGFKRADAPTLEMEKAVEDAGAREVRRLSANLRPLVVVGMIAPLLGLLGTVWGMIQAFQNIALRDAIGKPELLAAGISQALITTAAGLAVAIPTQAAYYYFRARIDRFVRQTEALYVQITDALTPKEQAA